MKSSDHVGITFVNAVVGRGILSGVVNIQLGAFQFDADADGKISNDLATVCRLRMDAKCAEDLRDHLNAVLSLIDEAKAKAAPVGVVAEESQSSKPN